ncbi:hypothetical protein [Caballeronia sp. LZ034LL]|uniref:hypothetical protein n=1 Tax=Caballeronia sp. LZ034LL TaxID=3038567 RepID=UPI002862A023|nr:hypothetical protein [Caballeronia sp. LZ034LL]MDR5839363.1 hypothetical protein [Caballeronia sp. LZ034LL]
MSNADKRSTHTDALETLGMIHFKPEARDAIHLAVEPIEAGERLRPNDDVGIYNGKAYQASDYREIDGELVMINPLGKVDPFLPSSKFVQPGQKFWLVVYPRMITSLRHVWSHPSFGESQ